MAENARAKLFMDGPSQTVRLPDDFRLPGTEVTLRRLGRGVLLEPVDEPFDVEAWFKALDAYRDIPFMEDGRNQPPMPIDDRIYFEDDEPEAK